MKENDNGELFKMSKLQKELHDEIERVLKKVYHKNDYLKEKLKQKDKDIEFWKSQLKKANQLSHEKVF